MENKKPLILISNDDGYLAKGIQCLVDMVRTLADVLVCAPDEGRSGFACAFSATTPLRLHHRHSEQGVDIWSCNGTPVDCVKIALSQLCPKRRPSLIIGGINHGDNASVNVHYSGTMGVVLEGCMKYIPSVAFSLCDIRPNADFDPVRKLVIKITTKLLNEGLPHGVCLNVNFPLVPSFQGVRICRMAFGTWSKEIVHCHHPKGYDYYWMTGEYTNDEPNDDTTDNWAIKHGYVAITPTKIDVTSYETIQQIKDWNLS